MLQAEKPLPCCKAAYRQSRGYFLLCLLGLLVLNSSRTRSGVGFRPRSIILLQNGKIRSFAVSKKYVSSLTLALTHPPPSSLPVSLYPTYLWLASSHYGNACFNVNPSTRLTRCTFFSFSFFFDRGSRHILQIKFTHIPYIRLFWEMTNGYAQDLIHMHW